MLNTVPLWAHQRAEIDASWSVPARARLWEPRLGKTRVCAVEMRRLWEGGHITRFLVACPKTVAGVWRDELALCFPDAQALDLSDGRVADRFARLRQATTSGPVVVIVNYDVVHRALIPLLQWKPQYIVADEMHRLKSPGARRSRAMHQLGRVAQYRRGLSGTPDPSGWADFYSEYKYLAPDIFGTTYRAFSLRYLIRHPVYRSKVVAYKNVPELRAKVFSIASRVRRSDAWDVPEEHVVERDIELVPDEARIVDEARRQPYSTRLEALLRLQQATASVKAPYVAAELEEILEAGKSAVVFTRFREELARIEGEIRREHPDVPLLILHGDTPASEREVIRREFLKTSGPPVVLVAQIATGSLGISLRRAEFAIFSSLDWSYETFKQAKDRVWSPDRPSTLIYLLAKGTPDRLVLETVQRKQDLSEAFLDSIKWTP